MAPKEALRKDAPKRLVVVLSILCRLEWVYSVEKGEIALPENSCRHVLLSMTVPKSHATIQ